MNRGLSIITALMVLTAAFCVSGTVLSRERNDYTQENERYAQLENTFKKRAREILEEHGYQNSGVTITWTRDRDGARSYRVEVHHREIGSLCGDEKERLTETLRCGELCEEAEEFRIIYT